MENKDILVEKDGYVTIITLNRPDHLNALTVGMQDELLAALQEVDGDPEVRAIVLTGAGRAFCAGIDMSSGATAAVTTNNARPPPIKVEITGRLLPSSRRSHLPS